MSLTENVAAGFQRQGGIHLMASSTAAGATAGAPPATLRLKFIFANHDGVVVEYETEPTTLIKDLKVALVGRWPSGEQEYKNRGRGRRRESGLLSSVLCFPAVVLTAVLVCAVGHATSRLSPHVRLIPQLARLEENPGSCFLRNLLSVGGVCGTLHIPTVYRHF